ncbi:class I SAM-dependent methyltransferase [Marinomonas ostreistagni]|uniref:class I SAM-dependent methyltransferase n=1 Tax=Marinomonas ostreistagni TaxID=359209 RepID=UPI00194E0D21|nr:class I SAM-dependent methyltransferase [Marinomonas ostreistagni]MBM6549798.1 class I SAM-dependent methyltransferase [Marinomonas ostreistagni]
MDVTHSTQQYYADHAESFAESTQAVDMSALYERFVPYLSAECSLLDAGCGSGRDAKFFQSLSFRVAAFDASPELAALASEYSGVQVAVDTFQGFTAQAQYDAIWCCASLLHVPKAELGDVMQRLARALAAQGVIYMSFKYGDQERVKDGRFFCDQTEQTITAYLADFEVCEMWVTGDQRVDRSAEKWLNVIVRKQV